MAPAKKTPVKKTAIKLNAKPAVKGKAAVDPFADMRKAGLLRRGSDPALVVRWQSTGIPQLDEIMRGGIPFNRYTEIYAQWSAGKTLLAQLIAGSFQRSDLNVALIDTEASYDERWWLASGVDTEALEVSQPPSGEAAISVIKALIESRGIQLIVLDSVAGMYPQQAQDADPTDSVPAAQARLMGKFYTILNPVLKDSGCAVLMINQTRASFGPGNYDVLPGGVSQQFWSAIQLRLRRTGWIESGGEKTGFKMQVTATKHKLGRPWGEIELPITFDGQFDYVTTVVQEALDHHIIVHAGAWYRIPEALVPEEKGALIPVKGTAAWQTMGHRALVDVFKNDPNAWEALKAAVFDAANSKKGFEG